MPTKICHQYASSGTCSFGDRCKFQHVSSTASVSTSTRRNNRTIVDDDAAPLAEFFAQYSMFSYNANNSATTEFYRMCDFFSWERDDHERKDAREGFRNALTKQFNSNYGTNSEDLNAWQALCARLGVSPIPETLKECRQTVMNTHVNLVDLVDVFESRRQVTIFRSVEELSEYTKDTGKYFPKENAYAGDLLKYLLRQILDPSKDFGRRATGSGGGRRHGGR
ncbi:hypothetical protein BDZ97DRAFT_1884932 [Flammula alnicola]|nr:hypothetical protein BDZ97DRAFT_1884932 [Flammula alnicola]